LTSISSIDANVPLFKFTYWVEDETNDIIRNCITVTITACNKKLSKAILSTYYSLGELK